ncbi:MAG: helix-turn-helix domain-containing protein [Thermoplasmata archaeon]|nr:helix-turn-helix domain-containing protein [Thermoplasmata archaeon]
MRIARIVVLAIVIPVLLIPISVAEITPEPVWPPSHLLPHDEAHNLTTWFAGKLNVQIDTTQTGEWFALNQSSLPEGLRAEDSYYLPLVNGGVEARYLASGMLKDVVLDSETQYVAQSDEVDDLKTVTYQIASDLELNYSQANFTSGIAVWFSGPPQDESIRIVGLQQQTALGSPYNFNTLYVGVRPSDLRVVYVYATVWYQSTGDPLLGTSEVTTLSQDNAEVFYLADTATSFSDFVAVWNGTTYVYLVHTHWDAGSDSTYRLDEWVEVNSGDVLGSEGPDIIVADVGLGNWLWLIMAIVGISLVVGLAMFYRINSERALDHFTRGRIFGYLQANPGANYTMIRESLRLSNGTAAYHLWVLERLGFVRSVSKGRMKQFYPQGVSLSKGSLILTRLQYSMLDLLEAEGPLSQSEIAKSLEMSRQRSHYNVKVLRSLELVQRTDDGKEELSFKGEEMIAEGENGLFISPSSKEEGSKEPT